MQCNSTIKFEKNVNIPPCMRLFLWKFLLWNQSAATNIVKQQCKHNRVHHTSQNTQSSKTQQTKNWHRTNIVLKNSKQRTIKQLASPQSRKQVLQKVPDYLYKTLTFLCICLSARERLRNIIPAAAAVFIIIEGFIIFYMVCQKNSPPVACYNFNTWMVFDSFWQKCYR